MLVVMAKHRDLKYDDVFLSAWFFSFILLNTCPLFVTKPRDISRCFPPPPLISLSSPPPFFPSPLASFAKPRGSPHTGGVQAVTGRAVGESPPAASIHSVANNQKRKGHRECLSFGDGRGDAAGRGTLPLLHFPAPCRLGTCPPRQLGGHSWGCQAPGAARCHPRPLLSPVPGTDGTGAGSSLPKPAPSRCCPRTPEAPIHPSASPRGSPKAPRGRRPHNVHIWPGGSGDALPAPAATSAQRGPARGWVIPGPRGGTVPPRSASRQGPAPGGGSGGV